MPLLPLFPLLFTIKRWDRMPWSYSVNAEFILLLYCFLLCWVFVAVCRLSLVAVPGHLIVVASLLWHADSRAHDLQQLWHTGLVALWHVEYFQTRDWNHVPCIGRQIPSSWTTREVLNVVLSHLFVLLLHQHLEAL